MKKPSPNTPCPCGSRNKYKKCCQPYHRGAWPDSAFLLMKSRYSAYALGQSRYIITTTHPDNPDYTEDTATWIAEINAFSEQTEFRRLDILKFEESDEEAFVTFRATFGDGEMVERSRFVREEGKWLYHSGEFLRNSG